VKRFHLLHVLSCDFKVSGDSTVSVHSAMCSHFGTWLQYLGYVLCVISYEGLEVDIFSSGAMECWSGRCSTVSN